MDCLTGIRVVDFSWVGAGAYCALLAGFLGAEVIKIESRHRLDLTRYVQPESEKFNVDGSALFNEMNLGKRSVTLNLSKAKGVELARELIKTSDAVVENFRPGVMKKLGLDYASIVEFKPDIVMVSYSLSGQVGPEYNYLGYAPVAGALSGLSYLTGYKDDLPCPVGGEFDLITGAAALIPVIASLYHRRNTGKGQYIDFSSREAGSCFIGEAVLDYAMNSRNQSQSANRNDVIAPNNCYRCLGNDTWVSISIATDDEWARFCHTSGHSQWLDDTRFCDAYRRWQNQDELDRVIEDWTSKHTEYEVMDMLQKGGVAAVPSFNTKQLSNDIHIKERGVIQNVQHPVTGAIDVLGIPWKLSGIRPSIRRGPLLGEDNKYVFCELLGLSEDDVRRLEEGEVIY
ncbi:MAG: CoA transferase [Dehalococcoidia bacterium]|jgi:benzylsuccinate CoA-transferase BbsF subunit